MVICLERGADLHMAQLMPLPLTVSCFSKIQIGFTFVVPAHLGSFRKRAVKRLCVLLLLIPKCNSLSNHVLSADTVNWFKNRLDKFWSNQGVLYNHKVDLHGTGNRSTF